jgi:hypothetical protein
MKYLLPILLLLLAILSIVAGTMYYRHENIFSHIKTAADCSDKTKLPASCQNDPNCCAIWNDGECLKGKVSGTNCESKTSPVTLSLYILAFVLFGSFVVTLIMKMRS